MANKPRDLGRRQQPPVVHGPESPSRSGGIVQVNAQSLSYQSPIPPPEILAGYADILPDAPDRILAMAEKQLDNRIHLEQTVIRGDNRRAYIGQGTATLVSLVGFASASYFAYLGHPVEGASVATGVIAALATVFLKGSTLRRDEREDKAKIMAGQKQE